MPGRSRSAGTSSERGCRRSSTSTIRRILHAAGLICPEPRKRPRSSYTRFEMAQPNEMWQSDFIHWRLANETDVEVLNWLDDHSRYLLSCTTHQPVRGDDVVAVFLGLIDEYGTPASTLTDNGSVYTSRFTGGRNAFEYVLPILGVRQKNGAPGHPQTQGKTERFHQTLQRWLRAHPTARTLAELQQQLDEFREHYNERRPHRALNRGTPGDAYRATPKATPATNGHPQGHYRLRYDRLDTKGKMTLRRAGTNAPPRDRHHPRPQTRPRARRRPPHHRHRTRDRRGPLDASDRARQHLLAQPKQEARPMAELPEVRPMSRLIWDLCPDSSQPTIAYASNPRSFSQCATRTLVASRSQVQPRTIGTFRENAPRRSGIASGVIRSAPSSESSPSSPRRTSISTAPSAIRCRASVSSIRSDERRNADGT